MNKNCRICNKDLPLTLHTKMGMQATRTYCETCAKARTKVLDRYNTDCKNLIRHYELLKGELALIEDLKKLIALGKDADKRIKEYLETGKGYWEGFDLGKYNRSNKKPNKRDETELKKEIFS